MSENTRTIFDVLRENNYLVLDTETTGLDHDAEICQIAVVNSLGVVHHDSLVKPVRPIPPAATAIHGISNAMVQDAPTFALILPALRDLLIGRDVVVYNAVYDRKMLHRSAEAADVPKTEWKELSRWWCAMETFAGIFGEWNAYHMSYRWQKLSTAAAYYNITTMGAHTALADCMTTLAVCRAMLEQNSIPDPDLYEDEDSL